MAEEILSSKSFHNHIKLALGYLFTKDLLVEFVQEDTNELIENIRHNTTGVTECHGCGTPNVLECPTSGICNLKSSNCRYHSDTAREHRACPNGICDQLKSTIESIHRDQPTWSNTDARKWCTSAVEVAKCFMPEKGYDAVASFDKIDFHGIISVLINNKRFQNKLCISLTQIKKVNKLTSIYIDNKTTLAFHLLDKGDVYVITMYASLTLILLESKVTSHYHHYRAWQACTSYWNQM